MRGLATKAMIADRYGLRLDMNQLAEVLNLSPHTLYIQIMEGTLAVPTYKEGRRRWASYDAVADYLDAKSEEAEAEHKKKPGR